MAAVIPFVLFSLMSFGICLVAIPRIILMATKHGIVDRPGGRKKHEKVTPYMGGLGLMLSLPIVAAYAFYLEPTAQIVAIMIAAFALFAVSLIDDIKNISPVIRLCVQLFSAMAVVAAGITIPTELPEIGIIPDLLAQGISIFFIVALINAFNFMDGVDGLAGGLGFITCGFMGITLLICGQTAAAILAGSFAAALLAFLNYNYNPARIFMGDCGSTVLGFFVAVFALMIWQLPVAENFHMAALAACIIPLLDLARVALLRIFNKRSPFSGDRNHLHHILLRLKNEARATSWKIWLAQLLLIGTSIFLGKFIGLFSGLFALLIISLISYNWIYYNENKKIKKSENKNTESARKLIKRNPFLQRHIKT